jgi:hypothetical protein
VKRTPLLRNTPLTARPREHKPPAVLDLDAVQVSRQYVDCGRSIQALSREHGVPTAAIRACLGTQGVKERKPGKTNPDAVAEDVAEVKLARDLVYARSQGYCEKCGLSGATDWHHRVNAGLGGLWLAVNGMHLHRICHDWIGDEPVIARSWGWSVRSRHDPMKVPVYLAHRGWATWSWLLPDGDVRALTLAELEAARARYGLASPIEEAS